MFGPAKRYVEEKILIRCTSEEMAVNMLIRSHIALKESRDSLRKKALALSPFRRKLIKMLGLDLSKI